MIFPSSGKLLHPAVSLIQDLCKWEIKTRGRGKRGLVEKKGALLPAPAQTPLVPPPLFDFPLTESLEHGGTWGKKKIVNYLYRLKKRSISPPLKISFRRACD